MLWLLAACIDRPAPPGPPRPPGPGDSSVVDSQDSTLDTEDFTDPIERLDDLPIETPGLHVTSGVLTGDHLVIVGEDWGNLAGLWVLDLSDPDAPVFAVAEASKKRLRRVCGTGSQAWALGESGDLLGVDLEDETPRVITTTFVGYTGDGIDCGDGWIAWGMGADGGGLSKLLEDGPEPHVISIPGEVRDVLIEGDRLWSLAYGKLTAWSIQGNTLEQTGEVSLDGTCRDISAGQDWLAVACGAGGVALVDRQSGEPELLGNWRGYASARAVDVQGERVLVAGWTDLLVLDASNPEEPWLLGTEPAHGAVMAVAAGDDGLAYAADWSQPFVARITGGRAPEVRASPEVAVAGEDVTLVNDGPEALWVESPSHGELAGNQVEPGGSVRWSIPSDAPESVTLLTDDPDEVTFALEVGVASGLQLGDPAPDFIEQDLQHQVWELSSLRGKVVFLGLFDAG